MQTQRSEKCFSRCAASVLYMLLGFFAVSTVLGDGAATYKKLREAYLEALEQSELSVDEKREEMMKRAVTILDTHADAFKSSGNIGFHHEARKMSKKISEGGFYTVDPQKLMSKELREMFSGLTRALRQADDQGNRSAYRIQKVMITQLESLIGDLERSGETDVAGLARAEQKRILENETFQAFKQKELESARRPSRPHIAQVPTPRPPVVPDMPPMLEVDVFKKSLSEHYGGLDYDDQEQNIQFTVKIRSRELLKTYGPLNVEVWGFGRHVNDKKRFKMLLTDTLSAEGLDRGETVELDTKSVKNLYDDNDFAQFGFKFYGYVSRITEKETGKVVYTKVSPSRLEDEEDTIVKQAEGTEFSL